MVCIYIIKEKKIEREREREADKGCSRLAPKGKGKGCRGKKSFSEALTLEMVPLLLVWGLLNDID